MLTLYLIIFCFIQAVLTRVENKKTLTLVQIIFPLLSIVFLFVNKPFEYLSVDSTAPLDLYLLIPSLLILGILKLCELVIDKDQTKTYSLQLSMLFVVLAAPSIDIKVLSLLVLLALSTKTSSDEKLSVPLKLLLTIMGALFLFIPLIQINVLLFVCLYATTFFFIWNSKYLPSLYIYNSIVLWYTPTHTTALILVGLGCIWVMIRFVLSLIDNSSLKELLKSTNWIYSLKNKYDSILFVKDRRVVLDTVLKKPIVARNTGRKFLNYNESKSSHLLNLLVFSFLMLVAGMTIR